MLAAAHSRLAGFRAAVRRGDLTAAGYYYHPSRHSAGKPIVAGWWYQQI